jgi:tRNA threonylcarbamoyladenosine biosynthesis protein TsaE
MNMYDLGYDEYIYSEGVTVIEWADLIKGILPEERIDIRIKRIDDDKREISIEGKGLIFEKLARELNNENTFD